MAKGRKTGGRQPGSLNKATIEMKQACAELVDDPAYRAKLKQRLLAGTLSPALESLLWYYAKGRPRDAGPHASQIAELLHPPGGRHYAHIMPLRNQGRVAVERARQWLALQGWQHDLVVTLHMERAVETITRVGIPSAFSTGHHEEPLALA
jgi:hypothetical protein